MLPVSAAGSVPIINPKPNWTRLTASRSGGLRCQIYQAIVDGILVGGVYALMAVGLTLIFGVLDIINIAQGVLVILGAYLSYALSVRICTSTCSSGC